MPDIFKVSVIGLGYFSQFHLNSWASLPDVVLGTCFDPNPTAREVARASFGLKVSDDLNAVLRDAPDIVDIVAPPTAHARLIRAVLEPGRTVICQKPFCTSIEEAVAVVEEAKAAGTRVIVHENFRFQPWYRTIGELLREDLMGEVFQIRFALRPGDGRGAEAYLDRQPVFQTMPRLLIHETAVHFIDLFQYLAGPATAIYSDIRRLNPVIAGEDDALMVMTHHTGVRSVFDGNRLSDHVTDQPRRTMGEMEIEGEAGVLSLNGMGQLHLREFGTRTERSVPLRHVVGSGFGGGCVHALNAHVIGGLREENPIENEACDYLPVVRLCELAYQSAEQGRRLTLSDG